MLPRDYTGQHCSIAGTLAVVGDRWTLLVVREAFLGTSRFDDFLARIGLARTVLADRLSRLTSEGILERVRYQQRPDRFEYRLTAKGLDLFPVLAALMWWGDRHVMGSLPPLVLHHRGCGGTVTDRRLCARCGAEIGPEDVEPRPGPGAARNTGHASRPAPAGAGQRSRQDRAGVPVPAGTRSRPATP